MPEHRDRPKAPTLTTNLDHLRWLAAMMVIVQHCRGFVFKDYSPAVHGVTKLFYALTGFSHQAVVIFFVISGYLVGGKAVRMWREGRATDLAARRFVIDRFSRIFIVLWPALAITAIIAAVAPDSPILRSGDWVIGLANVRAASTPTAWAATAFLLNELAAPSVQWDNPLWSLAFEWTYYMIAAAFLFIAVRKPSSAALLLCVYAAILILLSAINRMQLLTMFPFWLVGALAAQARRVSLPWLSLPLFLLALLASRISVMPWLQDAFVASATALLLADNWFRARRPAPRLGHALASFSFSLYAIHFPVLLLGLAIVQKLGFLRARMDPGAPAYLLLLGLVGLAYVVAWAFAQATERQTERLRDALSRRLLGSARHPPTPPDEPVSAELENVGLR